MSIILHFLWFLDDIFWPSWSWSYGCWINNYLCNQFLSPLMLWVRISIRARYTTLCDKVCQWLATGRWFPPPIKLTATKELKYCWKLNTINQTKQPNTLYVYHITLFMVLIWHFDSFISHCLWFSYDILIVLYYIVYGSHMTFW